ncbi:MAG: dihydrofolate reductase [Flavobacteriales bacterium]|nr:dihydrofolate reductase [Flavobacteriales bacterium]
MKVSIIVAMGRNREIGKNNQLLWHLPSDMQFFRDTTYWHHVIMGRKNYESIPAKYRPLVDRTNVVISRNPDYSAPECFVVTTLEEALDIAREGGEEEAFIIGGGEIYRLALESGVVDRMYITYIDEAFPQADTFFPTFDTEHWTSETILENPGDLSNVLAFKVIKHERKTGE